MLRWRRRGRIYVPGAGPEAGRWIREFAQSPQALVLADRVRVYFSTRQPDADGVPVSRVAWVDFDPGFREILGASPAPVIGHGGRGCFDEHGIFPMHVFRDGERILAYTSGWSRRVSVAVETAIGLAESLDGGLTFSRRFPGPVLAASPREPFLVGDPFVLRWRGELLMWYIFGVRWIVGDDGRAERVYKIGVARSRDGVRWERVEDGREVVPSARGPDECQALPTVFVRDGLLHMVFCHREATGFRVDSPRAYRLGMAVSADGVAWERRDPDLGFGTGEPGAFDDGMQCYPHAFTAGGKTFLLYNGNAFGRHGFGLAELETP